MMTQARVRNSAVNCRARSAQTPYDDPRGTPQVVRRIERRNIYPRLSAPTSDTETKNTQLPKTRYETCAERTRGRGESRARHAHLIDLGRTRAERKLRNRSRSGAQ